MKISKDISFKAITTDLHTELYALMKRIYCPTYKNYWEDKGEWYVDHLYNKENIEKELSEEDTDYFFVVFKKVNIGIIRIVYNLDTNYKRVFGCLKLHRLYLDHNFQNRGIGKIIMNWLIAYAEQKGYTTLWLEVMKQQKQAVYVYEKLGFIEVDEVIVDFPMLFNDYRAMSKMIKNIV